MTQDAIPEKRCTGPCGRTLPLTEFHRNRCSKTGYRSQCKRCTIAAQTADLTDADRAYHREYYANYRVEHRVQIAEYQANYWRANKDAIRAKRAVTKALKRIRAQFNAQVQAMGVNPD